jgi:YHS domain-containing protein
VWVVAEVYEQEASSLRAGGVAQVILKDEGRRLPARIADSLPQSEAGGGTVKLRLELDNPRFALRPDMLVDVELPVRLPSAVTVPVDALVDSGARARVYVEHGDGVFEPRAVETGWRTSDRVEILRGVKPGERVVAAATFLVDSESRLKNPSPMPAATRIADKPGGAPVKTAASGPVKDPNCGMTVDSAAAAASGNMLTDRGKVLYFCSKQCKQAYQSESGGLAAKRKGDDDD